MTRGTTALVGRRVRPVFGAIMFVAFTANAAVVYDESVLGDIDTPFVANPADLFGPIIELSPGENEVLGSQFFSVTRNADGTNTFGFDFDVFRFVVPKRSELVSASVEVMAIAPTSTEIIRAGMGRCSLTNSSIFGSENVLDLQRPCADTLSGEVSVWTASLPIGTGTYGFVHSVFQASAGPTPVGTPVIASWSYRLVFVVQDVALARLRYLIDLVQDLDLQAGIGNALDRQLQNALNALERAGTADSASAVGILRAFIYSVEAQRGKALTEEQADELVTAAYAIIDALTQP